MTGPNALFYLVFIFLLIQISSLSMLFVSILNIQNSIKSITIGLIELLLNFITTYLLIMTSLTDPGYLMKNDVIFKQKNFRFLTIKSKIKVNKNGVMKELKYCETCMIFRPPKSSHCRICNNCVRELDHHCIWLGNCVGTRNYMKFIGFLIIVNLKAVYSIIIYLITIIERINYKIDLKRYVLIQSDTTVVILSFLLITASFIFFLVIFKLLLYHFTLISKNISTYQEIKKYYLHDIDYLFNTKKEFLINFIQKLRKKSIPRQFRPNEDFKGLIQKNFDSNIPLIHNRNLTNHKSKSNSYIFKLRAGEIFYSDNDIEYMNRTEQQISNERKDSKVISRMNSIHDSSLNKKIFSIINSSGTEEDIESSDVINLEEDQIIEKKIKNKNFDVMSENKTKIKSLKFNFKIEEDINRPYTDRYTKRSLKSMKSDY